ncbi:centaurin beta, putative [Entamoeba invadens IP1]|uniref:centaurin beta, putative n=1 Tax=Entamoeba invadens IP1 TaxID=370355 RepID=UPI0002C3D74A|nr:centaurin beta, putative [Entamoeba invadens IP1]ELP93801.1 centaurin beta, putative [Entamoeba invadens IP1]|eukprot:XP_004260572.1 centaurin beta, putative [Entamoeba invadens IP1]
MSLPVLIDLTDKPFDAFNPYLQNQIYQTRSSIEHFEHQWEDILDLIPSIIQCGDLYFNKWLALISTLGSMSEVTPISEDITSLYMNLRQHFEYQMLIVNELKIWRETVLDGLGGFAEQRKAAKESSKQTRRRFQATYNRCIRQYPNFEKEQLEEKKKEYQLAVLREGNTLNKQIQLLTLLTEDNIVHLFNMYSKYISNTAKRHFDEETQTPKVNSLIVQANAFRSSIAIAREPLIIPHTLGGFLTRKESAACDKRLYYIFDNDCILGLQQLNDKLQEMDRVNIITTNFKPVDNTLECNGINGKFTFYTATKEEAMEWKLMVEKQKENVLNGTSVNDRVINPLLNEIMKREGNTKCSECGCKDPQWISVNLGILFCIKCSGIHRSLGVAFSRVKSTTLDNIEDYVIRILDALGNDKVNSVYQQHYMLTPDSTTEERSNVISRKYIRKQFVASEDTNWEQRAVSAVQNNTIEDLVKVLAHIQIVTLYGKKLLITAVRLRHTAIACYLTVNGYDMNEIDENGNTALHIATETLQMGIVACLVKFKCEVNVVNQEQKTAYDIAVEKGDGLITSVLRFAMNNDFQDLNEVMTHVENQLSLNQ